MNDQDSIFSVRFLRFRREEFYHEGHEVHEEKLLEILHGPYMRFLVMFSLGLGSARLGVSRWQEQPSM
jgi:hypothetical protein